ncbi:hypothetical protein PIB30_030823 [Stylosanthes scabra]|uniref:Uncharacterized protein n=1 Tax=Stylosanthes scabra TaxID=79078 RepID=A0ABU6SBU6_9FABA|nr:hypothetical protein [Stylosanthes scabra]
MPPPNFRVLASSCSPSVSLATLLSWASGFFNCVIWPLHESVTFFAVVYRPLIISWSGGSGDYLLCLLSSTTPSLLPSPFSFSPSIILHFGFGKHASLYTPSPGTDQRKRKGALDGEGSRSGKAHCKRLAKCCFPLNQMIEGAKLLLARITRNHPFNMSIDRI